MSTSPVMLFYDDSAYVETTSAPTRPDAGGPLGLMGRQVAGKQFLTAYLRHARRREVTALVRNAPSVESLKAAMSEAATPQHPWTLRLVSVGDMLRRLNTDDRTADVLYFPCPMDSRFAWARQQMGPHGIAYCGVTHTLCSANAVDSLCQMVISPYEPYDRLICTSRAVINMVTSVTDTYCEFLKDRHGGHPQLRPKLELIPLGVDTTSYSPPTSNERIAERSRWKIAADEIAVLFVGRLSHHAKAHPFPMFAGLATAAAQTNTRVHLLMAGWAASPAIQQAFAQGATAIAPNVRCTFVDGVNPDNRYSVWRAADVFTSLSDNIQETFGLVIIEAMACGLPVVATDWNGYRDLVVDGESGILVPTHMVQGATTDTTVQLILGEVNYDHFLAQCNQAVAVDVGKTSEAFTALLRDPDLRKRMGAAGRKRAVEKFDWKHVVAAYESLWEVQAMELATARRVAAKTMNYKVPSIYPPPETSFDGYPTTWLHDQDQVRTSPEAAARLEVVAALPITNYEGNRRLPLPAIRELLLQAVGGCTLAEVDDFARQHGASQLTSRATIAWLMKYGMLDRVS